MSNIWSKHGFRANPYDVAPIPPDEEGERLLVGRDAELRKLRTALASATTHPTVEGPNGVGKTSLVSVAGYQLRRGFERGEVHELFIPLERSFQLTSDRGVQAFLRQVWFDVAQAMLSNYELLGRLQQPRPVLRQVNEWLNSPLFKGASGSATFLGVGAGAGGNVSANSSAGFTDSGFAQAVRGWLRDLFPPSTGAFVCVIDNLELLETSKAARDQLEALRDEIFNQPGLRWVLCGARGIIRSVASSSRLQGVLADPIELQPVLDAHIEKVIERRVSVYGSDESYAPVEPDGFRHLYEVANRTLRTAMKFSQDFSLWLEDTQRDLPEDSEDKKALLEVWMADVAEQYTRSSSSVGERAWQLFDEIARFGGSVSPGDFESLSFNSSQAMRAQTRRLEDAQLLDSVWDDSDQRRKTIEISARGWIVRYHRAGYCLSTPPDSAKI